MPTQLSLYNGALRVLKERKLASLSENREPRRLLDDAWGDGGVTSGGVKYCLEMGMWTFATRTVQIDYSPSVEPTFGYRYAYNQPEDMVKPCGLWQDERMQTPLIAYVDERHYWYCDLQTIYVSYVSNAAQYGLDLSLWPETFVDLVEARLAQRIAGNLTQGMDLIQLAEANWKAVKLRAESTDAMKKPTKFLPEGSWTMARRGNSFRNSRWDGSFR